VQTQHPGHAAKVENHWNARILRTLRIGDAGSAPGNEDHDQ
jgi:hypothetical protein